MQRTIFSLAVSTAVLTFALGAQANPTVEKDGVIGNREGRSLYTFDKDSAGKSNCNGGCASAWPAFTVANPALADADFTVIKRDDGTQQWAFKGMPLYFFAGDSKPGEVNGDKQGGVWHVLRSGGKQAAPAAPAAAKDGYSSYSPN